MKTTRYLILMAPLALLVAGCVPVRPNSTIAEWESDGQLPRLTPTGNEGQRVYSEPARYPDRPNIVVEPSQQQNNRDGLALAEAIREQVEYDRSLAPSLTGVTIAVKDDAVILQGTVKSEFDARIIVDDLRGVPGVRVVKNNLEIVPD